MTELITAPPLGALTDEQLAEAWQAADVDDPDVLAAFMAEFDQRDAADRAEKARERRERAEQQIRSDWYDAMHAQRMHAEDYCRGWLLSPEAKRANAIAEQDGKVAVSEWQLWTGPAWMVEKYGSEEIKAFFQRWPRLTLAEFKRQRSRAGRIQFEEWRDQRDDTDERTTSDEHHHHDGPGLDGDEPRALRREPASPPPPRRPGGTVPCGGRGPGGDGEGEEPADGGTGGPGGTVRPGHPLNDGEPERQAEPGELKHVLDETAGFVGRHIAATPAQVDAMTLYAAATYALHSFPTFGHLLLTAEQEASGKTAAMMVTAALSANPLDASGTSYALQAALAAASNAPEQLTPTLYYDEISSVFGRSGLASSRDPIADILRKGYKRGATRSWSVNRTSEPYSIYTPFIMAGLRNAVPRDIRTRCIVIVMRPGTPRAYFDAREAEPEAQALAACLGQAVASRVAGIAAFRARAVHPRLRDRHLEVWEPLFAVAYVLGGQEWLNKCLAAFRELALAESDQVTLSPRQQVLRDAVAILDGPLAEAAEEGFVGGLALRDEMRRLPDRPLYAPRSPAGMSRLISDAMMPVVTTQKRVGGEVVRGYFACQIREAWDAVRPADMEDAAIADEVDPFETAGGDVTGVTTVTGVTGDSAFLA